MKNHLLLASLLIASPSFAQDPGFQSPTPRRTAAPAPQASGNVMASAALMNSMETLDNTIPIQPGDIISMRIVEDRGDPIQIPVGATGEVYAPHIGLVKAAGRTSRELAFAVKSDLEKSYYKRATVVVAIDQRRQERGGSRLSSYDLEFFTVYGQVLRQGKYELPTDEDVTISQAILRAGGFAQFANPQKVKLVRKTPQGNKTILVNLDTIMARGQMEYDVYLRNSDVIIVDEKKINF
jgi:protein involved in polysaccharide export with SLBB domain